jgi:hypothetical protein
MILYVECGAVAKMEAMFWDSKPRDEPEEDDQDRTGEPQLPLGALPTSISMSQVKPQFHAFGSKGPHLDLDDTMGSAAMESIAATGELLRKIGKDREVLSSTQSSLMRAIGMRMEGGDDASEAHRVYPGSVQNSGTMPCLSS